MGSAKEAPTTTTQLACFLRRVLLFAIRRRAAIAVVLVFASCSYGGWRLWSRLQGDVLTRPEYTLAPHQIQITPAPAWIRADVKTEALRGGSLEGRLSMMDEQLAEQLAKAFALHPWVARVEAVSKHYPGRVTVELVYRRPAAMVEVPGGLFPVDEQGVLLPSEDFSTTEAWKYPRIAGIVTQPLGPVGGDWGDRDVIGGVRIAVALREVWSELRLHSIRRLASVSNGHADESGQFEVVTHDGTVIPWGHAPGSETAGEMPVAEKIARVKKHVGGAGAPGETARREALHSSRGAQ